jgi:hypothetical protein
MAKPDKKRRDEEDFRELGAYLSVAADALLRADIKARKMYRQDAVQVKTLRRLEDALSDFRMKMDSTWLRDVNSPGHVPGPEPFYGAHNHLEAVREISGFLDHLSDEADRYRSQGWGAA